MQNFKLTDEFQQAYKMMEHSTRNLFITGRAGTGKSTLLGYFRSQSAKNMVVLAPTGMAAINVSGQTIHSFFYFKPDMTPEMVGSIRLRRNQLDIIRNLDTIVIDESSMLRADLLDCINSILQLHGPRPDLPFGGVQIIFFGDLYQLPPVLKREEEVSFKIHYPSPYFFDAKSFPHLKMEIVELDKIFRQSDDEFISLLGAIRHNELKGNHLKLLNSRFTAEYNQAGDEFYLCLTTTNAMAERINQERLARLDSNVFHVEGTLDGAFDERNLPTPLALDLKINAQVMLLNNDQQGRWVNGSIGKVVEIDDVDHIVSVELADGEIVDVTPYTWQVYKYFFDEERQQVQSEVVGMYCQFPLKLAWAVTIHKSQGQTFERVVIDIGSGAFAHGQTYVALSRCTSLEGIVLKRPISARDILLDKRVVEFYKNYDLKGVARG